MKEWLNKEIDEWKNLQIKKFINKEINVKQKLTNKNGNK